MAYQQNLFINLLGLVQDVKNGVVIVGAQRGFYRIAIPKNHISNTLVDLSKENIRQARAASLNVLEKNIFR